MYVLIHDSKRRTERNLNGCLTILIMREPICSIFVLASLKIYFQRLNGRMDQYDVSTLNSADYSSRHVTRYIQISY